MLGNSAAAATTAPTAEEIAAESAIQSAFGGGDVNASAFQVPGTVPEASEDTEAAVPEGVLVTETPMRAE